jgi:hypothetical protein
MTRNPDLLREHQAAEQTASYWRVFTENCRRDPRLYFSTLRNKLADLAAEDSTYNFKDGRLSEFTEVQIQVAISADPVRASELLHHQMALVQPNAGDITPERSAYFRSFVEALQPFAAEADRQKIIRETQKKGKQL